MFFLSNHFFKCELLNFGVGNIIGNRHESSTRINLAQTCLKPFWGATCLKQPKKKKHPHEISERKPHEFWEGPITPPWKRIHQRFHLKMEGRLEDFLLSFWGVWAYFQVLTRCFREWGLEPTGQYWCREALKTIFSGINRGLIDWGATTVPGASKYQRIAFGKMRNQTKQEKKRAKRLV